MPEDRSRFPSAYDRARSRDVGMAPQQEAPVSARIRTLIFDALGGNSPDMAARRRAMKAADMLTGAGAEFAVGITPVLGDAQAMYEAKQAYDQGNMGRAAMLGGLGALGMVPVVGDAAAAAGRKALSWKELPITNIKSDYFDGVIDANQNYEVFGLRVVPRGYEVDVGDRLPVSKDWDDGIDTGIELDGTSAISLTEGEADWAIKQLLSAGYDGDQIVLIGGKNRGYGQDVGEVLIGGAEVISSFSKPKK